MTEHELICEENDVRLDKFVASSSIGVSRSMAASLIENGNVLVNGS